MWFVAFIITAVLLLGSMLINGRLALRNHAMLATMEKMHEKLKESDATNVRLAEKVETTPLKEIEDGE